MVSSYLDFTQKSKKGLYLPAFGLGLLASITGRSLYIGIAVLYATLVAIIEPWLDSIIQITVKEVQNAETRSEVLEQSLEEVIFPRILGDNYSRIFPLIFAFVLIGYFTSFVPYLIYGFDNNLIVLILMLQYIIPVTSISNFIISATSEVPV